MPPSPTGSSARTRVVALGLAEPRVLGAAELDDDVLAAVAHLTGEAARPLVDAVLEAIGAEPTSITLDSVAHEPGRECIVTYGVSTRWPDGSATHEVLVAVASVDGPPPGAAVLRAEGMAVGAWRYPFDPALPALADVVFPDRVTELAGELLGGPVRPTVLTYRPGRRAVVRLEGPRATAVAKVLRPARAGRLVEVHHELSAAGVRVPRLLGADEEAGSLLIEELVGGTVRDHVVAGRHGAVGRAVTDHLAGTLETLATVDLGPTPARRQPMRDLDPHVALLVSSLGPRDPIAELALRVHAGVQEYAAAEDPDRAGAEATVHGDLHDAQVVVADGRLVGLLDLDDVGRGCRADDPGNLVGHALTMSLAVPSTSATMRRWCSAALAVARSAGVAHDAVAARSAAVALSLATGPFRSREPEWRTATARRVELARALLSGEALESLHRRPVDVGPGGVGPVREVSEVRHTDLTGAREN